jgi:hypothetical protein
MKKGALIFALLCIFAASFLILGFVGVCASNIKLACQVDTNAWIDLHAWEFTAAILHLAIFIFGTAPLVMIRVTTDANILADDNGPIIIIFMITSCFVNIIWTTLGSFNIWFFNTRACQVISYKLYIVSYTMIVNGFCILLFPLVTFVLHKRVK